MSKRKILNSNKKNNQGITLITLVIAVIVLIILATVSIGVLGGENGIIKKSKYAKEQTEISEEIEILKLCTALAMGEDPDGNLTETNLRNELDKNIKNYTIESKADKFKVTFESGRAYIVDVNGNIIENANGWDDIKITYTVTYNQNTQAPVEKMPTNQTKTQGVSLKLSDLVPTREGYAFYGWSTNISQTEAGEYQAGATYTQDVNLTLYAVWIKNYIGYYADIDGDETVDGIIYADLAVGGSGTWNNDSRGNYEYVQVTEGLKSYTVSSESYTGFNGKWTQPVITTVNGSTGADRFYVMALEDFNPGTLYYWYDAAAGELDKTVANDFNDFGQGKTNTTTMIVEWNKGENGKYGVQNDKDMWGVIQKADNTGKKWDLSKWFVPSKAEWAAFGDMSYTVMKVEENNYLDYGLNEWMYWSSTQNDLGSAYIAFFERGDSFIGVTHVLYDCYVRLSATF